MLPFLVQKLRMATRKRDEGIGSPSKCFAFPDASFGTEATVALNLASLASPQQIKPVRITVSRMVRSPTSNARRAGATPKDIYIGMIN